MGSAPREGLPAVEVIEAAMADTVAALSDKSI